jgi:hypothetical protein
VPGICGYGEEERIMFNGSRQALLVIGLFVIICVGSIVWLLRDFSPAVSPGGSYIKRVVYIVDASASQAEAFSSTKKELKSSIDDLVPKQLFAVIFFDSGLTRELEIDGGRGLHKALPRSKGLAVKWISDQTLQSGEDKTNPSPALERAFTMEGGPPDIEPAHK